MEHLYFDLIYPSHSQVAGIEKAMKKIDSIFVGELFAWSLGFKGIFIGCSRYEGIRLVLSELSEISVLAVSFCRSEISGQEPWLGRCNHLRHEESDQ